MTKPEFDFSKHIEVPDEWIERALAIPETCRPRNRRSSLNGFAVGRRVLAAASIVLVLTLGITVYFLFGNKNLTPPVATVPVSHSAATPSEAYDPTVSPDVTNADVTAAAPTTAPSDESAAPTAPSQPGSTAVTPTDSPTDATVKAIQKPTQSAAQRPTQKPTQRPTQPSTQPPAQRPTQTTVIGPTEVACEDPSEDNPPPSIETQAVETPCSDGFIDIYIYVADAIHQSSANETVYCRVYDSAGRLLGSSNLYDISHRAKVYTSDSRGVCYGYYYAMTDDEISRAADSSCTYAFYTSSGYIIATGTATVY